MTETKNKTHNGTSRFWPFTWNNYTETNVQNLLDLPTDKVKYIVFGYERSKEGTPHLQGYVEFKEAIRINGVKTILDKENGKKSKIHIGDKDGKPSQAKIKDFAIAYCKKGIQSHEEWESQKMTGPNYGKSAKFEEKWYVKPRLGQGTRNDWIEVKDFIKENPDFYKVFENYPELAIRYPHGIQKCINEETSKRNFEKIKNDFKEAKLRKWQKELSDELKSEPDDRKIIWYVDEKGNAGKTWFAKYLVAQGETAYFRNGKTADICYSYKGERTCVIDLARSSQSSGINYEVIEELKDGMVFSPKYESGLKMHSCPHVVVFSNTQPDLKALSSERWSVRIMTNGQVIEQVNTKTDYNEWNIIDEPTEEVAMQPIHEGAHLGNTDFKLNDPKDNVNSEEFNIENEIEKPIPTKTILLRKWIGKYTPKEIEEMEDGPKKDKLEREMMKYKDTFLEIRGPRKKCIKLKT